MRRWLACLVVVGVLTPGCGDDDDDDDAAPGADAAAADSGTDAALDSGTDAAPPDASPDSGTDAGVPGAFGADCVFGEDCESGSCLAPIAAFDVGTGYCSQPCASDDDCGGDPVEHEYTCAGSGDGARCVRTCDRGFGCTDTEICLIGFALPSGLGTHDICVDLRHDACDSDADCIDEFCLPLADRDSVFKACFAPRDQFGAVLPLQPPGSRCDPHALNTPIGCDFPRDCPDGWDCRAPGPGLRDQCIPAPEESCSLFCLGAGVCGGLCEDDEDCPADMGCGRVSLAFFTQGTGAVHDDVFADLGLCQYTAGSRTSCSAEADCAATGAGGARETCVPVTDEAGVASGACVTPLADTGLPGDACGDDPATEEIEPGQHCHGICFEGRCAGLCETVDDCPADPGVQCRPIGIDASHTASFCLVRDPCTLDEECSGGEVCQPYFDAESFGGECGPPFGTLVSGDTCKLGPISLFRTEAERCENGICQFSGRGRDQGTCGGLCGSDVDCPADHLCASVDIAIQGNGTPDRADDVYAPITRCVYAPGSRATCQVEDDCAAGETCTLVPVDGVATGFCITEVEDGRATGQSCGFAIPCATTACQEGWYGTGFCTELCDAAADCPEDFECRSFEDDVRLPRDICMPLDDPRGTALP